MLTPDDIRNPARASGFDHVNNKNRHGGYRGQSGRLGHPRYDGEPVGGWQGPRRDTAEEAAQDYCDYINGNPATPAKPALKSAGHNGRRASLPDDPEIEAALGVLRDAKGQAAGKQGFVYCIGETRGSYVKIGYSTNPQARVAELQTGNPRQLWLMGVKPGTAEDEAALHQKYIKQNVLQEWFRPTKELLSEFDLQEEATP